MADPAKTRAVLDRLKDAEAAMRRVDLRATPPEVKGAVKIVRDELAAALNRFPKV
jgi:hypothetical protein